ncbi:hypothetical protein MMC13_001051 [Lambiella insularis]|nr:hypothetical protein [Lambiella insularis]
MAMLLPFQVLGASLLLRGSTGIDNPSLPASPNLQTTSSEDPTAWPAHLIRRMENVNPNARLPALNPNAPPFHPNQNPAANQQPAPNPEPDDPPDPTAGENWGVPGVNLPCGWLDGRENPDGETGVDPNGFLLYRGRYILHVRWTRVPHLADIDANVNLIDVEESDEDDWSDHVNFPGTRMPHTVVVDNVAGRHYFVDLRRDRRDDAPPGQDIINDAAIIWWFERVRDRAPGGARAALTASSAASVPQPVDEGVETPNQRLRPAGPMDEGVEPPSQRQRVDAMDEGA